MLRLFIALALIGFASHNTDAQRQDSYVPLQCRGEIPEEFRTLTATKVQKAQAKERLSDRSSKDKRSVNDFLLRNNYVIDELLNSGKVLFGDSVTEYVNAVAGKLLVDNSELQQTLRFYVVKSTEVNAFTTNMGIVFITVGLLAQIENEAQLAFVLAHEIAHFEKEHSINSLLETKKIINKTRNDRYNGYDGRIKLLSTFSKDLEFQADEIGFMRFTKAGYNKNAASNMMDVLQFSFTPFLDVPFNPAFLELDSMKFPKELLLAEATKIPLTTDDSDDSESSHPNIRKRREILQEKIAACTLSGENYLMPKTQFENIRRICRNEMIHLDLIERRYMMAFYHSFALSTLNPGSKYYDESMAKSLYGISMYCSNRQRHKVLLNSEKVYENLQTCNHIFTKLNNKQINLIAIRYLMSIQEKYQSVMLNSMLSDLVNTGIDKHELTFENFESGLSHCRNQLLKVESSKKKIALDSLEAAFDLKMAQKQGSVNDSEDSDSKYARLRKEAEVVRATAPADSVYSDADTSKRWSNMFQYMAFTGIDRFAFSDRIAKLSEEKKASDAKDREWNNEVRDHSGYYKRHGFALGIDKVVVVDPFFFIIDERKGLQLMDSEKELIDFNHQITQCADQSNLESEILFPKSMNGNDVDRYNHMALMNDWVGEKLSHEDSGVEMIPIQTEQTSVLADIYGTDYFCYTGVFTTKQKRGGTGSAIMLGILLYPILPFVIVRAFTPLRNTFYYFLMYNMRTGTTKWVLEKNIKRSADNGYVNSLMYDTMSQIKAKTKSK